MFCKYPPWFLNHSILLQTKFGKAFWSTVVTLMLVLGLYWCVEVYLAWIGQPVLTTINTAELPIEEVKTWIPLVYFTDLGKRFVVKCKTRIIFWYCPSCLIKWSLLRKRIIISQLWSKSVELILDPTAQCSAYRSRSPISQFVSKIKVFLKSALYGCYFFHD